MTRLAWGLAVLAVALRVVALTGSLLSGTASGTAGISAISAALTVAFAFIGALVAMRQQRNPIGWLFLGVAVSSGLASVARGYLEQRLADGGGGEELVQVVAAYHEVSWIPFVAVPATLLLLLFPDGRLLSRRWHFAAGAAVLGMTLAFVGDFAAPRPIEDFPSVDRPLEWSKSIHGGLQALAYLLLLSAIIASAVSLVVRYRRAPHVQRQQIKWLAAAGGVVAVTFPVLLVFHEQLPAGVADAGIMLSILLLPVAAGVAILRYRLYDIDLVINRTLVYGALTALLAGAYLVGVLLLQLVLSPSSDLAIAGSTLAVAALFRPARARIQTAIDRRFFRRRYDAQRTLESFAARLRDEVTLDAVGQQLRGVVTETMQPAHVSLWLRETT